MPRLLALSALLVLCTVSAADEPSDTAGFLRRGDAHYGKRQFADAVKDYTACLKLDPKNAEALHHRGSAHFMVGKFAESVADFDAEIKLRPRVANGHWQRGISLYYAGKYDEGAKQFVGYENVSTDDVENAVWHFMCLAKKDGLKKARSKILKIGKDGRTPMMEVYELFKGKMTPDDVMKAANEGKLSDDQRKPRLFYAHLYLGIYHDLQGEKKKAVEHLAQAAGKYRIDHYMGEVARVHHELLTKKQKDK